MRLDELVECWTPWPGGRRSVEWGPRTEELVDRVSAGPALSTPAGSESGADAHSARLLVARPLLGELPTALPDLLDDAGDGDLVLLLLPKGLDELAPGPVLEGLRRADGLLVGVHEVEDRLARTALAVTRDSAVPLRSHVLLEEVSAAEAADALRNEWLLTGAAQRAQLQILENRVRGHRAEVTMVRKERNIARTRWEGEKATSRALRERIAELEDLRAKDTATATANVPSALARGMARVRSNPVRGTGQVARAVARRLRG